MKAYELQRPGKIANLRVVERPISRPAPGQVLVRIGAVSLNYRDLVTLRGGYGSKQKSPLIPCSDAAGTVEAIGEGVVRFRVGDRVLNAFLLDWLAGEPTEGALWSAPGGLADGVLCEYRLFPEHGLLHTPVHLSDTAAAAFACAGVTAWNAVIKLGRIRPGQVVLTQGTGGVSLFALQFAKLAGALVVATSSSDAKIERLRALGADETINYRSELDWGKRAVKLTGGRGVDLVVDVGGAGTLNESIRACRVGGTIASIGVLAAAPSELRLALVAMRQLRLQGVACGSIDDTATMLGAVGAHQLQPVLDRQFPLMQASDAFEYLASGQHFGKIVVTVA